MGIPFFFKYLCRKHKQCLLTLSEFQQNINVDNLYFDLNGLIHPSCQEAKQDKSGKKTLEEKIALKTLENVSNIIELVNPSHSVGLYVDGVAPFAKITQQRSRRYKSLLLREKINLIKERFGKSIDKWDTNMISPGTPFMLFLMSYFENNLYKLQKQYNKLNIHLSTSDEEGEGEQKIMKEMRNEKGEEKVRVIHGLDADLIMLCLLSEYSHLYLFREDTSHSNGVQKKYIILDIDNLRKAIVNEVNENSKISLNYENKNIICDYVFMCFLVGNDFIPSLMMLSIDKGDINLLLKIYTKCLGKYKKHITNGKIINYDILLEFLKDLMKLERDYLKLHHHNYLKKRYHNSKNLDPYDIEINKIEYAPLIDKKTMNLHDDNWEYNYYSMSQNISNIYQQDKKNICQQYIEGINWIIQYYQSDCPSWSWTYSYLCSPLVKDLVFFLESNKNINIIFDELPPLTPERQLLSILPPESLESIPVFKDIPKDNEYLYPRFFEINQAYKTFEHQCYPYLPQMSYNLVNSIII